jgi:hypothetical protein
LVLDCKHLLPPTVSAIRSSDRNESARGSGENEPDILDRSTHHDGRFYLYWHWQSAGLWPNHETSKNLPEAGRVHRESDPFHNRLYIWIVWSLYFIQAGVVSDSSFSHLTPQLGFAGCCSN